MRVIKLIKKTLGGSLLILGASLSTLATIEIFHPETSTEQRKNSMAVLFVVTLPSTAVGSWLIWSVRQQNRREEEERLRQILFNLIKRENGTITVLKFAMEAQISAEVAKQYLNRSAEKYGATFEVDEIGNLYYQF